MAESYLEQMKRLTGLNEDSWSAMDPMMGERYGKAAKWWGQGVQKMDAWASHIHDLVRMAEDTRRMPDRRQSHICGALGIECPKVWKAGLDIHTAMLNGGSELRAAGFALPSMDKLNTEPVSVEVRDSRPSVMARDLAGLERKLHQELDKLSKSVSGYGVRVATMANSGERPGDRDDIESKSEAVMLGTHKIFDKVDKIMERVERLGKVNKK